MLRLTFFHQQALIQPIACTFRVNFKFGIGVSVLVNDNNTSAGFFDLRICFRFHHALLDGLACHCITLKGTYSHEHW